MDPVSLLIVGNKGGTNVGGMLLDAALASGLRADLSEARLAFDAPKWVRRFNWWFRGRRPTRLHWFSNEVVKAAANRNPSVLLTTGIAPLTRATLETIGRLGVVRVCYLTDDPWNPAHKAHWFLDALPAYDVVFTPRRANQDDLVQAKCPQVHYLPFAYSPELHFPKQSMGTRSTPGHADIDVLFAGGADQDRVPYIAEVIRQGFNTALYGDYWDRYAVTRSAYLGHADPGALRQATWGAQVCLCLVRRANRDGHVMRSFEIPAMGGCMLAEDTSEHREIFGEAGLAALYFQTIPDMLEKLRWLLGHEAERFRLATAAHQLITQGRNTYRNRLETMLCHAAEIW